LALVVDGDEIEIDLDTRRLDLLVSAEVLAERRAAWQAPPAKIAKGWLARYARQVSSAASGAVMED
jgi:dihydroxy-acid dehydratase